METLQKLPGYGLGAQKNRVPVTLTGRRHTLGWAIMNCYFQEILGPRTFGSVLNVGAGRASVTFRQNEMFAAGEYHTLEMPGSDIPATYQSHAEKMEIVPDARYDWVISTAVLEHAGDPWAVAREAMRVTKPGGFIYTLAPFSHQVHTGPTYGDYWRFTPQGLERLFPGCKLREVEVWGDDPIFCNAYAVLVQKAPYEEAPVPQIWISHENEDGWRPIVPDEKLRYEFPLYQLLKTPFDIANDMHALREQISLSAGTFLPIHEVTRGSVDRYARRIGTLGFRGTVSFITG